eukprot:11182589-Alexandrium_andersonii.AAC.1
MSASLVGSEMCIRDSCAHRAACPACRRSSLELRSNARPAGVRNSNCAVSYTHLTLPTICSV